jgi:hypothetical protein
LARWLSRDPLRQAEEKEGPNLFAYVRNNPVNYTDLLGLKVTFSDPDMQGMIPKGCCTMAKINLDSLRSLCVSAIADQLQRCQLAKKYTPELKHEECSYGIKLVVAFCKRNQPDVKQAAAAYLDCLVASQCTPDGGPCNPLPAGGGKAASVSAVVGGMLSAVSGGSAAQGAAQGADSGWSGPSLPPDVANALNIVFR